MTTFGLVHGAYHGAWCWDLVAARLTARGHRVAVPDLPCDDPAATADTYRDLVIDSLGDADDVILVGHSLGSYTITRVAAARPVDGLIYLCMLPVGPTPAFAALPDVMAPEFNAAERVDRADGANEFAVDAAVDVFFHACPPDLAAASAGKLRAQFFGPVLGGQPLESWPGVPFSVILARDDRVIAFEPAQRAVVEHLGVEPVVLPGSHSPFVDEPDGLVDALEREAAALQGSDRR